MWDFSECVIVIVIASEVETQKQKHSVHAFFRKNQRRSFLRAEKYGDLTTAEHDPQRRTWISEQSPIRCRGTSSRHSMESVWDQNFTGDGEEFTKVLVAVTEAKSYSYAQFLRIWQVLWRIIMESSNNYTSSLKDKRNCRSNWTSSKRSDINRIIAIWIGW